MFGVTAVTDEARDEIMGEGSETALSWMVMCLLRPRGLRQFTQQMCARLDAGRRHYSANRKAVDLSQTKLMEELIAARDRQVDLSLGIDPTNTRAGVKSEYDVVSAIRTLVG